MPVENRVAHQLLVDEFLDAHIAEFPPVAGLLDATEGQFGNADGIDLIMPDWFYRAVLDDALVLTIDPAYFSLTGGLERWLYRIVRKHGGQQRGGW